MNRHFRIGSRGSKLALYQTALVQAKLKASFPAGTFEIIQIKTKGDQVQKGSLSSIGRGIFTREIEEALLKGEVDLAVHSAKDLETELPSGLMIGALLEREDSRDALLALHGKKLNELKPRAKIGTSSLRRKSQIARLRPDLETADLRGNVETRIRKMEKGEFDGIVMAAAGINRLGFANLISEIFDETRFLPQAGQGAIAVQVRKSDTAIQEAVLPISHKETFIRVETERSFLGALNGGCQVPIGVASRIQNDTLHLEGAVFSLDGKREVRDQMSGSVERAKGIGISLANRILEAGGGEILEEIRKTLDGK